MLEVRCPGCQCRVEWSDAYPYRPFCSARCKNADFCAWVNGERRLPDEAEDEQFSESPPRDTDES